MLPATRKPGGIRVASHMPSASKMPASKSQRFRVPCFLDCCLRERDRPFRCPDCLCRDVRLPIEIPPGACHIIPKSINVSLRSFSIHTNRKKREVNECSLAWLGAGSTYHSQHCPPLFLVQPAMSAVSTDDRRMCKYSLYCAVYEKLRHFFLPRKPLNFISTISCRARKLINPLPSMDGVAPRHVQRGPAQSHLQRGWSGLSLIAAEVARVLPAVVSQRCGSPAPLASNLVLRRVK